jgi:hypothetical protein
MADKERDTAIQQGQKYGGPQQPNQRSQGELGAQQHGGGGTPKTKQGDGKSPPQEQARRAAKEAVTE